MISIDKSDRSLQIPADFTEPDIEWFDNKNAPFDIRGVLYDSEKACYMRMPILQRFAFLRGFLVVITVLPAVVFASQQILPILRSA